MIPRIPSKKATLYECLRHLCGNAGECDEFVARQGLERLHLRFETGPVPRNGPEFVENLKVSGIDCLVLLEHCEWLVADWTPSGSIALLSWTNAPEDQRPKRSKGRDWWVAESKHRLLEHWIEFTFFRPSEELLNICGVATDAKQQGHDGGD